MESINNSIIFLKQKGVRDTFQVLTQFENYKIDMRTFYKELKQVSYYNSFYRVKDAFIEKGIIILRKDNNEKYVALTQKGIDIYNKLIELAELLRESKY